jgi:hypothetical protein
VGKVAIPALVANGKVQFSVDPRNGVELKVAADGKAVLDALLPKQEFTVFAATVNSGTSSRPYFGLETAINAEAALRQALAKKPGACASGETKDGAYAGALNPATWAAVVVEKATGTVALTLGS